MRKKNKIILLAHFILLFQIASAQSSFELLISTPKHEKLLDIEEDEEGNYIMVGTKAVETPYERNAYIVKVSASGEIMYEKEYIIPDSISIFHEIIYSNDSLIIFGVKGALSVDYSDLLWNLVLDDEFNELRNSVYNIPGYFMVGTTTLINHKNHIVLFGSALPENDLQDPDLVFFEFSRSCDSLLNFVLLPMDYPQNPQDMLEKYDQNGYLLFASGAFPNSPTSLASIVEFDSSFNLITADSVPGGLFHQHTAKKLSDTSYLLTGKKYINDPPVHRDDLGIVVLDSSNQLICSNHFGMGGDTMNYPGASNNVDFISKDNIFYGGVSNIIPSHYPWQAEDSWIILNNLDSNLNLNWQKFYGGDAFYILWALKATQDGGCIMLCTRYDELTQYHEYDIYILKVDSNGLLTTTIEEPQIPSSEINTYPNPAIDYIHFSGLQSDFKLNIYDITGRQIASKIISSGDNQVGLASFKPGIYYYQISRNGLVVKAGVFCKR